MAYLDNYRTHYCPDSGFSLVSENDLEFEVCTCFQSAMGQASGSGLAESEARIARTSPIMAEQIWYRTIAALAKFCGTGRAVHTEPLQEQKNEQALVAFRKA